MAIKLKLSRTERVLFCSSKWWGDPDMPENMEYPMIKVDEDGEESEYPLTFICQINCEELAQYDRSGLLPSEGMLYFFAAFDEYLGYDAPYHFGDGVWPKGSVMVKYAKKVNFETFRSVIMVDEDDNPITEEALEITFSTEDADSTVPETGSVSAVSEKECIGDGIRMLCGAEDGNVEFLHICNDPEAGIALPAGTCFKILLSQSDLKFGNFKRSFGVFCHLPILC